MPNAFHSDSPDTTYSPSPKFAISPTHSRTGSSVSPPRSPRISSLLEALGDAISPDEDAPESFDSFGSGSSSIYDDAETVHPRGSYTNRTTEEVSDGLSD